MEVQGDRRGNILEVRGTGGGIYWRLRGQEGVILEVQGVQEEEYIGGTGGQEGNILEVKGTGGGVYWRYSGA